jgi:hypothetical protein
MFQASDKYERYLQARYIELTTRLIVALSAGNVRGKVENLARRRVALEAEVEQTCPQWLREFKVGPLPLHRTTPRA